MKKFELTTDTKHCYGFEIKKNFCERSKEEMLSEVNLVLGL